jgi:hypothetical protein
MKMVENSKCHKCEEATCTSSASDHQCKDEVKGTGENNLKAAKKSVCNG